MYRLSFYVPEQYLEQVKNAIFQQGAGVIGNYQHCCWQIKGEGQFMPLENSNPHTGTKHQLHTEPEYKVEMVCPDNCIEAAIKALICSHPYEEPAYEAYKIMTLT